MSRQLLERNTRFLLIWLPVVLLVCSVVFFIMLRMQTHHMQEKQLLLKQQNIWSAFIEKSGDIDRHISCEYDIVEGTAGVGLQLDEPRDTMVYHSGKKAMLPFQILTSQLQFNNKNYLVTTYASSTEISHLVIKVFITEACILALLLVAIIILNRKSSGWLWRPFFATMQKVNEYEIARNESLTVPIETGTTEFNELNHAIKQLIERVNSAYHNQKQFVENASHEMQTPLAIIRSKLELLINQPNLTEKNASLLEDITEANNRLSQMNRTLLLLAKIENNQFPETELIDLSKMLKQVIEEYSKYYEHLPALTASIAENVTLNANRILIEVLMSNLVKNAIEHNRPQGKINISLSDSLLLIENSGPTPEINTEELFERFKKGSHQTKTTGLGLALVRQICNLYHFEVTYHYHDGWHRITVLFHQ
jgi:signal transduction histidine kinase